MVFRFFRRVFQIPPNTDGDTDTDTDTDTSWAMLLSYFRQWRDYRDFLAVFRMVRRHGSTCMAEKKEELQGQFPLQRRLIDAAYVKGLS